MKTTETLNRREFASGLAAACVASTGTAFALSRAGETSTTSLRKADLGVLAREDAFKLIGNDWMLVCAGRKDAFNMMTASWGGVGWLWNKPVVFVFIRPERYTHVFLEREPRFTLSFFTDAHRAALRFCGTKSGRDCDKCKETGLTGLELPTGAVAFKEARLVLDCRKLFKSPMAEANFVDKSIYARWRQTNPAGTLHDIYVAEVETVYTTAFERLELLSI